MCDGLAAMAAADVPWRDLFGTQDGQGLRLEMRMLRKRGRPFLAWPADSRMAAQVLNMYPAQTARARWARAILSRVARAGFGLVSEPCALTACPSDPFIQFLGSLCGPHEDGRLNVGILAGNAGPSGQRFVLLLFDPSGQPIAVVKAGVSDSARALIQREEVFLAAIGGKRSGIPKLRAVFSNSGIRALALDFFRGQNPRPWQDSSIPAALWPWVDATRQVPLFELPDWRRLERAAAGSAPWPAVAAGLRGRAVHPVIGHGDFAPWNVRVSPQGTWTAVDWERGEADAVPGWDWLHYVIRRAILVERLASHELITRVETLLSSPPFRRYAAHTGIEGIERELTLACLLHSIKVIQPTEGLAETRDLGTALAGRWGRGLSPARAR